MASPSAPFDGQRVRGLGAFGNVELDFMRECLAKRKLKFEGLNWKLE